MGKTPLQEVLDDYFRERLRELLAPHTNMMKELREMFNLEEKKLTSLGIRPGLTLVSGPPGSGKTSLLINIAREADSEGVKVVFCTGFSTSATPVPRNSPRLASTCRETFSACRPTSKWKAQSTGRGVGGCSTS